MARGKATRSLARRLPADARPLPADMTKQGRKDLTAMPLRLDLQTLFQHAGIPLDADAATL